MASFRKFTPVSKDWQNDTCNELGISLNDKNLFYAPQPHLGEPSTCFNVKGDGNCLFRSLAFAVSGNEELHMYFRIMITSFIAKSKNPIVHGETPDDYLNRTRMKENGVWGTDIELYFAAKFFNCSIFVFSKYGKAYDWLEFKPENKNTNLSIYLDHKNCDHYDVVTSVDKCRTVESDLSEFGDEKKYEPFILNDADSQHAEKDETQFDISMVSYKL